MVSHVPTPRSDSSPDLFGTLQREVNRVFEQMFGAAPAARLGAFAPSVEMKETDQGVSVTAEMPGMEEKDVEITLDGDLLTLSGEKKRETTEDKSGFHVSERSYGTFRRTLRLPWAADPAQASATFEKGVLTIDLPRPPEAQATTRRIPIKGAGEAA